MKVRCAWDLIGQEGAFRIRGGRSVYEAAFYAPRDGNRVRLARLVATERGIRQINRWVDPDTEIEVLEEAQ